MSDAFVPFLYRDFWDVPRLLAFVHAGACYLLDCPFDKALDAYPDHYQVFELPYSDLSQLPKGPASWGGLAKASTRRVGTIPVALVRFDPTLRQGISASVLSLVTP
jgi:hypothetical protein